MGNVINKSEPDGPVTIATFWELFDADFVKTMLDLEGIPAILTNECIILLDWRYANATGGIRVNVRGQDAARARRLLSEQPIRPDVAKPAVIDPEYELACPRCGSLEVRYERFSRFAFFLSLLMLGFPILVLRRALKCRTCRHRWKRSRHTY